MLRVLNAVRREDLARVHRDQLASLARATPTAMAGYAINVLIAVVAFRGLIPGVELAAWAVASLAICSFIGLRSVTRSLRTRQAEASKPGSPLRDGRWALLIALMSSLPWAILATRWVGAVHGDSELILMALTVGMAASGSVLLAPIPAAAVLYATAILLPPALKCILFVPGHQYLGLGALAVSFLVFLYGLIVTTGRLFLERLEAITRLQDTIAALSEAREETERVAMTDGLTGIANRRAFMARLNALNNRAGAKSFSIFYIDLDRFKSVNDALGHAVGDALLKSVSARITGLVREGDLVARLGGDEFAIVAQDIRERAFASSLAERLVVSLSEPYDLEGQKVQIGACVGVALACESGVGGEMLLKQADLAMFAAKEAGRGMYCIFEADMQRSADEHRVLELGLRAALVNDGFELFYQPVRNLETNAITSFECQVRWRHPLRGLLTPAQFLATAIDIGIAEDIGNWVIKEACRQAAHWPSEVPVGINMSSMRIGVENIAVSVERALKSAGLPPSRLELEMEVTEASLMNADAEVIASLRRLKDIGVSIALDDFGTGYSSLGYLVKFPFNRIKIDRLFVSQLGQSAQSELIVRSIAELAQRLNCSVVAEGIETDDQRRRVLALDVTYGQGMLLGAPLSASEAAVLLMSEAPDPALQLAQSA
ncbi:diguanylate cyclase/phosphodiesterase [Hyphomicrobium denitrificans ATCC 51888]|uniref:Diguanylate cyclase/phosphodiesterase n=1 Tax=Hyphomicrobium denitrificans (strain ATCC 51888 / DSM 1869 / NCIMB 11706 / TK 0415) TaxID=582899 RepID=D8JUG3_HYPDA|nr:EAL domain-containing protein [Hyphomicrobium denitrificans]ADJ22753.1 diguanylate cyclase/phosphodiesterase [Hyphomicrobium denitrificans ATCC 51888]